MRCLLWSERDSGFRNKCSSLQVPKNCHTFYLLRFLPLIKRPRHHAR